MCKYHQIYNKYKINNKKTTIPNKTLRIKSYENYILINLSIAITVF